MVTDKSTTETKTLATIWPDNITLTNVNQYNLQQQLLEKFSSVGPKLSPTGLWPSDCPYQVLHLLLSLCIISLFTVCVPLHFNALVHLTVSIASDFFARRQLNFKPARELKVFPVDEAKNRKQSEPFQQQTIKQTSQCPNVIS